MSRSRNKSANTGSVLHRLSEDPGRSLSARAAHHGARIFLLLLLAVLVTTLFPPKRGSGVTGYREGMVAPSDVIARVPFSVTKSTAELEVEKRLARRAVPPTFDFRPEMADTMVANLDRFFNALDSAVQTQERVQVEAFLRAHRIIATPSQIDFLLDEDDRAGFRASAENAAREIIGQGVVEAARVTDLTVDRVTIRDSEIEERSLPVEDILDSRDFFSQAALILPPGTVPGTADLFNLVLVQNIEYSYEYNVIATETDRNAAEQLVQADKESFLEGQAIVRQADPIGPATLERLNAYQAELRERGLLEAEEVSVSALFGAGLLNFMLFGLFGLLLFFNREEVYGNFRWLLLIALLISAYFGAAAGITRGGLAAEWLPISFVVLPIAVLWDSRMALFLVLIIASITGTLPPFAEYSNVLVVVAGGAAAALSVRAVRRRSETWFSIAIISATTGLVLFAHGLATSQDLMEVARGTGAVIGNATVSALLAMGFLFVFELFTGITTDQTLLEWADPTRPLLRRLSLEAPGTYAHTINVSNLAESAATRIGANGLLCRVGVFYHDVGKMLKPHYFVENQPDRRNPHDKLKPETSAAIVREHVTEGVRLAQDAKVPAVVLSFILEHHGTQRIGFFYEKAREESEGDVDPARFSYPGPKPQSKETAIVMLADSCESAARAMVDPTPERMRDLITSIVDGKIADGQLDESPLTFGEVAQVKEQFVQILAGVIHRRIEYPQTKHLTEADNGSADEEFADVAHVPEEVVEPGAGTPSS